VAAGLTITSVVASSGSDGVAAVGAGGQPSAKPSTIKTIAVDEEAFAKEFDSNQVAAERKYKGRRVKVTATVRNITDGTLSFSTLRTDILSMTQIACRLKDPDAVLKVTNGQRVTVVGTVGSQTLGVVEFKDCALA
jgi:hypothetical protein